jgi:DNA-binding LacI/PurR family transcriptional regulator
MSADTLLKMREDKVYHFGLRDSKGSRSLYTRIADELISEVTASAGSGPLLLPQERELAARFKVSRSTIRQALTLLEQYDLVQRRRGHGTLLTKPADEVLQVWRLRSKHVLVLQFSSAPIRPSEYYGRILAGIVSAARAHHQNLEIKYSFYAGEIPRSLQDPPAREHVAGVLVCGMYDDKFLKSFSDHGIPCVCADYWPHDVCTDAVTVDVETEAFQMASYLAGLGYRTVGFAAFGRHKPSQSTIFWDPDVWRFLLHLRRAVSQYGLLVRDEWVQMVPGSDQLAQKSMDRFVRLERLPEAMICFDGSVADRVLDALSRCGLRCPKDVGIITRSLGRTSGIKLTTMDYQVEELGRTAMQLMLERVCHRRTHVVRLAIASHLLPGESTRQIRPAEG